MTGWVVGNEELGNDRDVSMALSEMIKDRFSRDPEGALTELERYAGVLSQGHSSSVAEWIRRVGRNSSDVKRDFEVVRRIAEEFAVSLGDPDPFEDPDSFAIEKNLSREQLDERISVALSRGLIDAGRINEGRELVSEFDTKAGMVVEKLIQDKEYNSMRNADWRELRGVVENGVLKENSTAARRVLHEWAAENSEAAKDWFIENGKDDEERSRRVAQVVADWRYLDSDLQLKSWDESFPEVIDFLNQRDANGEPVTQGWDQLAETAMNRNDWGQIAEIRDRVSRQVLEETLERVKELGREDFVHFGGERLEFRSLSESDLEALETFGLAQQVQEKVDSQNREALEQLAERINRE